jgi:hypothetical protein
LRTSQDFLHVVQHDIHQLIEAFKDANHCKDTAISQGKRALHGLITFSAAVKFDAHFLVNEAIEVEDVLLLGPLALRSALVAAASASSSAAATARTARTTLHHARGR